MSVYTTHPFPTDRTPGHPTGRPRLERTPLDFVAIFFALLLVAGLIALGTWQFWHAQRIYSGVTIGDVPVGGLTRAAAMQQLSAQPVDAPLPTVSLRYADEQWPLALDMNTAGAEDAAEAEVAQAELLDAVNRAYLVGRAGDWRARLRTQAATLLSGEAVTLAAVPDEARLRASVESVASQVRRSPRPASQAGDVSIAAQPGLEVDVTDTVQTVMAALHEHAGSAQPLAVPLSTVEIAPLATAPSPDSTAADSAADDAAIRITRPLVARDGASATEFALDPAQLNAITAVSDGRLRVDEAALTALVEGWAAQVSVPARDARLRWDAASQGPVVVQPSRAGRQLNVAATVASLREALSIGRTSNQPDLTASLVIEPLPPAVDSNSVGSMGIRELVVRGSSYFAGSSAARVRNIEVAAEKFEGVVIPPGGLFSFNRFVEDISSATGFEDSLIIAGDTTAVGIGGGVCQVSTTVFRAAYFGGFPIVERYNHGYEVSWYGEPGLDATIYTPTVDFKFRNDTGAYLLIDPVVDGANGVMHFDFYGTKPAREVVVGEREVTDVEQPEPPRYVRDESLTADAIEQTEWQADGKTVSIARTIRENGAERTETLVSTYRPWQAVYKVGAGVEIPERAGE